MKSDTSRINTSIDSDIKARWELFLLEHHHAVRGVYGPELGKALESYMNKFSTVMQDDSVKSNRMNKTTRNVLKLISIALRELPEYPIVKPLVIQAVVKNNVPRTDIRTINTYMLHVTAHLKQHPSNDCVEKKSVQGFCEYVDRLLNESSLR